jgi:hypothetical protein
MREVHINGFARKYIYIPSIPSTKRGSGGRCWIAKAIAHALQ